jgi:hypothetical protein
MKPRKFNVTAKPLSTHERLCRDPWQAECTDLHKSESWTTQHDCRCANGKNSDLRLTKYLGIPFLSCLPIAPNLHTEPQRFIWHIRSQGSRLSGWNVINSLIYEDCSEKSCGYRGLPYSTGYASLNPQGVIGVFSEYYAVAYGGSPSVNPQIPFQVFSGPKACNFSSC